MKVLYVEDNPANVFLVKRVARMGNHEIINYIDGDKALQKFEEIAPDLVLMDIQLAGNKNGLDVVKALRARGIVTPIIAVTAYAMVGDKERCLDAGCDDYLAKPLPIPRLVEIFKQYNDAILAAAPPQVAASEPVATPEKVVDIVPEPVAPEPVIEIKPEATATNSETKTDVAPQATELKSEPTPNTESAPKAESNDDVITEPVKPEPEATTQVETGTVEAKADETSTEANTAESATKDETLSESTQSVADSISNAAQTEKSSIMTETKTDAVATEAIVDDSTNNPTTKEPVTSSNAEADIAEKMDSAEEVKTGE